MTAIDWLALADRIERGYIPALSCRQPYPHYIFHEGKDVENRDWPTARRGWVMLHTGKRSEDPDLVRERNLPLGGIVGVMRITDCVTTMASDWFFGRFGFVIRDARPIALIPCNGALSFFTPANDVLAAVAIEVRKLAEMPNGGGIEG